jgi:hypothetical protein
MATCDVLQHADCDSWTETCTSPALDGSRAVRQACCSASEQRIACWAVAKRTNTGIVVVVHALVGRSEISLELCGPKSWKRAGVSCAEKNNNFPQCASTW